MLNTIEVNINSIFSGFFTGHEPSRESGRARMLPTSRGPSRIGSGGVRNLTGRIRKCSKSPRVGSGGVRNLTGRVSRCSKSHGSGQQVFESHCVESRVTLNRPDPREVTRPAKRLECFGSKALLVNNFSERRGSLIRNRRKTLFFSLLFLAFASFFSLCTYEGHMCGLSVGVFTRSVLLKSSSSAYYFF